MIIASAIKFHIEATNEDVVLCGLRHGDIFDQLKRLGFKPKEGYAEIEQGFIDHKNQFLNRKDAYHHAVACGQLQITQKDDDAHDALISEDLW